MLTTPPPEWEVPPTRAGGGIGMAQSLVTPLCTSGGFRVAWWTWGSDDVGGVSTWRVCCCRVVLWWPPPDREFEFEWSDEYKATQDTFAACAASGDPNSFMMLLQQKPFHVDTMLQLFEYFRATGQQEEAAEMLQRYADTVGV